MRLQTRALRAIMLVAPRPSDPLLSSTAQSNFLCIAGVCEQKHSSGEAGVWEDELSEHQTRRRRAVPAAELHGQGSRTRSVFSDNSVSACPYHGRWHALMDSQPTKEARHKAPLGLAGC